MRFSWSSLLLFWCIMLFSPYQQKVVLMFLLGKEWRRSLRWFNRLLISFPNIDTFIISGSISSFSSLPLLSCFLPSFVNMPKNFPSILWGFLELGFYFLHDSRVFFFLFSDANLILILTTISLIGNVILFLPAFLVGFRVVSIFPLDRERSGGF